MNAKARAARQITKSRRQAAKQHRAGLHTLKSHALRAGLDETLAGSVTGALRGKAKTLKIEGTSAHLMRRTGSELGSVPVRGGRRYSKREFLVLAAAYAPRLQKYVTARELMLAY